MEYTQFINGIVKAFVPDIHENPELFDLVTTYQVHCHYKSCRKYKNENVDIILENFLQKGP